MPRYTSHIYVKPTQELILFLQSHPLLSTGLFHIRQSANGVIKDVIQSGLTDDGLVIVREVCDPVNEAKMHKSDGAPVISWRKLKGAEDIQVILPDHVPTLGFGKIYDNHEENPLPPANFLRFLKYLSTTYKTSVVFYHHYTAYEDRLADCEYAWVFDDQDFVYIRHVDAPYRTVLYTGSNEPRMIHDKHSNDQPILHLVMQRFGLSLLQASYRPYFSGFDWEEYRLGPPSSLATQNPKRPKPKSRSFKTINKGKRHIVPSPNLPLEKSNSQQPNRNLDLHGVIAALGERALNSTWLGTGVECFGESAQELYKYTDHHRPMTGHDLFRITSGVRQTIEGDFKAFDSGSASHWIFIRAWDGGGFYVETADPKAREYLKKQFEEVEYAGKENVGLFIPVTVWLGKDG
jgi:hypothetical protein